MIILTIRTDKPDAELAIYRLNKEQVAITWYAHKQLAETIHLQIKTLLSQNKIQLTDIDGIVLYKGPGSFTGLRIGASVANTLADSLDIKIVGTSGGDWKPEGIAKLTGEVNDHIVVPEYGAPVHITAQKK